MEGLKGVYPAGKKLPKGGRSLSSGGVKRNGGFPLSEKERGGGQGWDLNTAPPTGGERGKEGPLREVIAWWGGYSGSKPQIIVNGGEEEKQKGAQRGGVHVPAEKKRLELCSQLRAPKTKRLKQGNIPG